MLPHTLTAPVRPDGTFEIAGAPRVPVKLLAAFEWGNANEIGTSTEVNASQPVIEGVALALDTKRRIVHMIVRSTADVAVGNAVTRIFPGRVQSQTLAAMGQRHDHTSTKLAEPLQSDAVPPVVKAAARPGDLHVALEAPVGDASACAIGLPAPMPHDLQAIMANHMERIEVRCQAVPPDIDMVIVEVPPWPRLE